MVNYLYIHIPFCISKCNYCDFFSIPLERSGTDETAEYIDVLLREMELRRDIAGNLKSVYVGGGTPTVLSSGQIATLLSGIRKMFSVGRGAEITIEANPGTISERQLAALRETGINRISIGVQSLSGQDLCMLGRCHTAGDAFAAVKAARRSGFENISLDLIYGIPGQHMDAWKETMSRALDLLPDHVSAYELTPEKETQLYINLARGDYALPDELLVTEMYYAALETMKNRGYHHYEISNFARPGYECLHNLNYWNRGEYLGVGAGAHSFYNGKRVGNICDLVSYKEAISSSAPQFAEETVIREDDDFEEMIFLGLRKTEGIDIDLIPGKERLQKNGTLDVLISDGLVEIADTHLRLTKKGLVLSTEIMVQLLKAAKS